jgi:mRNA interferase HigB
MWRRLNRSVRVPIIQNGHVFVECGSLLKCFKLLGFLPCAISRIEIVSEIMPVISRKALREFWERHPDSKASLARWFKIMQQTDFVSFGDLRRTFSSADLVDDLVVFNISGNKYRLIASIHFNRGKVYVRHVLTHQEYDREVWKE